MEKNDGILVDTLFVGPTRPTMRWGVTWQALMLNMVFTTECFVFTHNLLWLFACLPIHFVLYLICLYDPRAFELIYLWGKTKAFTFVGNFMYWRSATHSPLEFNVGKKASKRKIKALEKRGLL